MTLTTTPRGPPPPAPQASPLYEALLRHRLIIPTGVPGVFGRGAVFEDVLTHFDALLACVMRPDGAERVLFPPILARHTLERSGYLDSFPQLAGSVFSFCGDEAQHQELSSRVRDGKPWGDLQSMTSVVLTPAACYPLYPTLTGILPPQGRLVDMLSWVFRHEPSLDPTRMQAFRVHELVRLGTADLVSDWRNQWLDRGLNLLRALGLPARAAVANDPFFGRGGRILAASQRQQELKFEVLVPVNSDQDLTAVCSFNYHQSHFGETFGIFTPDGAHAHSACLGFGMERIVMALFKTHGFIPAQWPSAVRDQLWS